jgi:hypothetical protein
MVYAWIVPELLPELSDLRVHGRLPLTAALRNPLEGDYENSAYNSAYQISLWSF